MLACPAGQTFLDQCKNAVDVVTVHSYAGSKDPYGVLQAPHKLDFLFDSSRKVGPKDDYGLASLQAKMAGIKFGRDNVGVGVTEHNTQHEDFARGLWNLSVTQFMLCNPRGMLDTAFVYDEELVTPPTVLEEARKRTLYIRDTSIWPQIVFRKDGEGFVQFKRYLKDVKKGKVLMTYWADEDYEEPVILGNQSWDHEESGHSQAGVKELSAIVGSGHAFETVKPLKLMKKLIHIWCPPNGLVLDAFAGSGTTGHAVLQLNDEAGTSRRFILVEQSRPERGDAYARTLTAERLKRVISGQWHAGEQVKLRGGFTFKTSTTQVDRNAVLAMQREEMVDLVLMSHWEVTTRKGPLLPVGRVPAAAE